MPGENRSNAMASEERYKQYTEQYVNGKVIMIQANLPELETFLEGVENGPKGWIEDKPWKDAYNKAKQGDYYQFEKIDPLARNYLASRYMNEVLGDERGSLLFNPERNMEAVETYLRTEKYNPLFRLGCSLLANSDPMDVEHRNFRYRVRLDDPGVAKQPNELYREYDG